MRDFTRLLWNKHNRHPGDRSRLFAAVAEVLDVSQVMYPGSYIDIAASFVFDDVTYVDSNRRAARFFDDADGVHEIIGEYRGADADAAWRFIGADYSHELDVSAESFDLLVSLYAGFVSESCTRYLRPGGWLLVNSSHGDVAMASIDRRYRLAAVVSSRSGKYTISERNLDSYLHPKQPVDVTAEMLHDRGRAIAYTKSPFAYVFERI